MQENEMMQNMLEAIIKNLIQERNDAVQLIRDNEIAIEILRKKYSNPIKKEVLPAIQSKTIRSKPEKKRAKRVKSLKDRTLHLIETMYNEKNDIITPKWVTQKCDCSYHTATKRIARAIKQELLTRKDKGVYEMRHGLRQELTEMIKNSPDKVDVHKLVELCMSRVKEPPKQVITIPTSISRLPEITNKVLNAGEVARDILRENNRPMHGVIELFPELKKRGVSIKPNHVSKVLDGFPGIKRTAPNTWTIDDTPPTDLMSSDQESNVTSV